MSEPVPDLVSQLKEAADRAVVAQDAREKFFKIQGEVTERIRRGESTGNKFNDLLILQYGSGDSAKIAVYEEIERRFKACPGQLFVMVEFHEADSGLITSRPAYDLGCFPAPRKWERETYIVGLITSDPQLTIDRSGQRPATVVFPTTKHVDSGGAVREGGFSPRMEYSDVPKALSTEANSSLGYVTKELVLLIGDQEIAEGLSRKHDVLLVYTLALKLGYKLPETPTLSKFLEPRRARAREVMRKKMDENRRLVSEMEKNLKEAQKAVEEVGLDFDDEFSKLSDPLPSQS